MFVSSAVPKPANWRIVHSRPRYIEPYTPRVYGYSPGSPIDSSADSGRSASVYSGLIGSPDIVENGADALRGPAERLALPTVEIGQLSSRGHRSGV